MEDTDRLLKWARRRRESAARRARPKPHTEAEVDSIPCCDICKAEYGKTIPAYADARLPGYGGGAWANVCRNHFNWHGGRLGLGLGQKFILKRKE